MIRLGDLAEVNPPPGQVEGPFASIEIADIDDELATATPRALGERRHGGRIARPGDVLFARISPSMESGKVAIVPPLETEAALVAGDLLVIRPRPDVDPRLIWAFLRRRSVREELRLFLSGSGLQRLRSDVVASLEFSPPSDEGWAEALAALAHLDEARRLQRPLTRHLRALPAAAISAVAAERPSGPLGGFDVEFRHGLKTRSLERGTVPLVGVASIADGWLDLSESRFAAEVSPEAYLERGDLLVVRVGGKSDRIGLAAVYESGPPEVVFSAQLTRIRCRDLDPDFLWAWLQTAEARGELFDFAQTTAAQHRIGIRALEELPVPFVGAAAEAQVAALARHGRRLLRLQSARLELLDRIVEAHLAATFADERLGARAEEPGRGRPRGEYLSGAYAAASVEQRRLWSKVSGMARGFGLGTLAESDADYAAVQHSLSVFEQLGLVVREQDDESHRWRLPDAELDMLS